MATPNASTDGSFTKTWKYEDGEWWLYKLQSTAATKAEVDYATILNKPLYNAIRDWRKQTARERHLPDGYVLQLKAVIGIANLQPRNLDELQSVPGIGASIAHEYGSELLSIVAEYVRRND